MAGNNLTDANLQEQQLDSTSTGNIMHIPAFRISLVACYTFVFMIGNVSNIAMLIVCLRQWCEAFRSTSLSPAFTSSNYYQSQISSAVTSSFVTNLAIADILLCVFSLTSTPYSFYSIEWPFGDFLCRFTPSTLIFAVCLVAFTSTVMAIDRHMAVCHPHSFWRLNSFRSSLLAIAVVWIASILACVPIFISYRVVEEKFEIEPDFIIPGNNFTNLKKQRKYITIPRCEEYWQSVTYRRVFMLCILIVQFVLPVTIISFCYIGIFATLHRQKRFRQEQPHATHYMQNSPHGDHRYNKSSLLDHRNQSDSSSTAGHPVVSQSQRRLWRTTAILTAMVAIFMACWMPIDVLLLIADYRSDESPNLWETNWFSLAYFSSHLLAMTSTLWNPLLYGWLNKRLRPEILKICFRQSSSKDRHGGKLRQSERNSTMVTQNDELALLKTSIYYRANVATDGNKCTNNSSLISHTSSSSQPQKQDTNKLEEDYYNSDAQNVTTTTNCGDCSEITQ